MLIYVNKNVNSFFLRQINDLNVFCSPQWCLYLRLFIYLFIFKYVYNIIYISDFFQESDCLEVFRDFRFNYEPTISTQLWEKDRIERERVWENILSSSKNPDHKLIHFGILSVTRLTGHPFREAVSSTWVQISSLS